MQKIIKKAILPVAGLGTRFLPATKAQPKEMLPIVDKPIIQFLVEEAVASGITEIIFVTGRGKRAIEDHFDYSHELEDKLQEKGKRDLFESIRKISHLAHFSYVRQNEPKGDGDAILKAAALINNEPVAVLFGDDIIDSKIPTLKKMIDIYCQYQEPVIALERVAKKDVPHYGIVRASKVKERIYRIEKIMEKPALKEAPSNLAVVGKYIINPGIFEELRRLQKSSRQEWGLAHALDGYSKKKPVYGYEIEGTRYDCGTKIGFLKAVVDYGLKHQETKKEFKKYLKSL